MKKTVLNHILILLMILQGLCTFNVQARQYQCSFYVSQTGSDANAGDEGHPFKTITRAKLAVRSKLKKNKNQNISVFIGDGKYLLREALEFDGNDSPSNGYKVRYIGGNSTVVSSLYSKAGWEKLDGKNIYRIKAGDDCGGRVVENGVISDISRYPNTGHLRAAVMPGGEQPKKTKFSYGTDFEPQNTNFQVSIWPGGIGGEAQWKSFVVYPDKVDYENRVIYLKTAVDYEVGSGSAYCVRNSVDFIDIPGESCFNREDGYLYYYPRGVFDEANIMIVGSNNLLRFVGAQNISFENASLMYTGDFADAVLIENSRGVEITDCEISYVGGSGVYGGMNVSKLQICGNLIHDTGAQGIHLYGKVGTKKVNYSNTISNNMIYRMGNALEYAEGIRTEYSEDNVISHNRIFDGNGTGITSAGTYYTNIGSSLGVTRENFHQYQRGGNNIIEFNDISYVNKFRQDTGLIYTARTYGNIVRNNHLHDSSIPVSYGYGLYCDDGCDAAEVYNNIIDNLQVDTTGYDMEGGVLDQPYNLMGVNTKFYNNIAVDCNTSEGALIIRGANESVYENKGLVIKSNIMSGCGDVIYNDVSYRNRIIANHIKYSDCNLWYNEGTSEYVARYRYSRRSLDEVPKYTMQELKENTKNQLEANSIFATPEFVNPQKRDYRLEYTSPAYDIGFKDIDYMNMGLTEDFKFADKNDKAASLFIRTENNDADTSLIYGFADIPLKLNVYARTEKGYLKKLDNSDIRFSASKADISPDGTVTPKGLTDEPVRIDVTYENVDTYFYVKFVSEEKIKWNLSDKDKKSTALDIEINKEFIKSANDEFMFYVKNSSQNILQSFSVCAETDKQDLKFRVYDTFIDGTEKYSVFVYKKSDGQKVPFASFDFLIQ